MKRSALAVMFLLLASTFAKHGLVASAFTPPPFLVGSSPCPPRPQSTAPTTTTTTTTSEIEKGSFQPIGNLNGQESVSVALPIAAMAASTALAPLPAVAATAGPIPSALVAYAHFLGIAGVAGGLISERFLIKPGLTIEEEKKINNADGVYGLAALSLLISGYFRVTEYAKGWDFYKNEPLFWIKMASVAVLGGLSFFPALIFFQRDQARQRGETLAPLPDPVIDRLTTIINAEILAFATIPLMATLMARGVLYVDNFPWAIGIVLYALSLGGAGYKYGSEALAIIEEEKLLLPIEAEES